MSAGYLAVTYVYGLRGNEGFWVDADRLRSGIDLGRDTATEDTLSHMVVSLLGIFKGEDGDRMHVFTLASESGGSGIKTRELLERVVEIHDEREETEECPAFCDKGGYLLMEKFVEEEFLHPILESLQASGWGTNGAIPKGLAVRRSSHHHCSCFRSLSQERSKHHHDKQGSQGDDD